MTTSKFPRLFPVDIAKQTITHDDYYTGDETITTGPFTTVLVFAWAIEKTQEQTDTEHTLRTVDDLTVYMRQEDTPGPGGIIRLPDGTQWKQHGNPENYDNNPWIRTGLVVVHARKVTG